jgi:hypothetical protein
MHYFKVSEDFTLERKRNMPKTTRNNQISITRDGTPDMRLGGARHNSVYVMFQHLTEFAKQVFSEQNEEAGLSDTNAEELGYRGFNGQTTGRPDMRLAPTRHSMRDVAMQEVLDRVRDAWIQAAINFDHASGAKTPLPSIEEIFKHDFLSEEIIDRVNEEIPEYEIVRKNSLIYETRKEESKYTENEESPGRRRVA